MVDNLRRVESVRSQNQRIFGYCTRVDELYLFVDKNFIATQDAIPDVQLLQILKRLHY